jgi:hypothetical protein
MREHQNVQPNSSDAISLPGFLRLFFGRSGPEQVYSIRGIIGQLFIFSIAVIYSLNILEYIPDKELAKFFLGDSLILSCLWILLLMIYGRKG